MENLSDEEALEIAVVANWKRTDFSFLDRANAIQRLKKAGFSDERISTRLGITSRYVRYYLAYGECVPDDVKKVLETSFQDVKARHSEALVLLMERPEKQVELANRIGAENMSGPKALSEAKKTVKPPKTPAFKTVPIRLPTNLYDELKEAANGTIGAS